MSALIWESEYMGKRNFETEIVVIITCLGKFKYRVELNSLIQQNEKESFTWI